MCNEVRAVAQGLHLTRPITKGKSQAERPRRLQTKPLCFTAQTTTTGHMVMIYESTKQQEVIAVFPTGAPWDRNHCQVVGVPNTSLGHTSTSSQTSFIQSDIQWIPADACASWAGGVGRAASRSGTPTDRARTLAKQTRYLLWPGSAAPHRMAKPSFWQDSDEWQSCTLTAATELFLDLAQWEGPRYRTVASTPGPCDPPPPPPSQQHMLDAGRAWVQSCHHQMGHPDSSSPLWNTENTRVTLARRPAGGHVHRHVCSRTSSTCRCRGPPEDC